MSSLEVEVDVNESMINRIEPGQRIEATLDAYPEWKVPARVLTTVPSADRQKATVKVRITFDALDPRILPDMGIKVAFLGAPPDAKAAAPVRRLVVPAAAVRQQDGKDVVLVVRGDIVERRAVQRGAVLSDGIEVLPGLGDGEQVVVEGPQDLSDGDRVRIASGP
jgi:hypothetical protein